MGATIKHKIGGIDWHEVMDRAHMVETIWCDFVLEHEALKKSPLKEKAERIALLIAEFYQEVGRKRFTFD